MIQSLPYQLQRLLLGRGSDEGASPRNVEESCGYEPIQTVAMYEQAYVSNGIAQRVIDLKPEATWSIDPSIVERDRLTDDGEKDTPWETGVKSLIEEFSLWSLCEHADKNSRIGRYGVILIGIDDAKELREPVDGYGTGVKDKKNRKLLYLNTFSEMSVTITQWDKDKKSPRYGRPVEYLINMGDITGEGSGVPEHVHWHRVVHIADNCLGNSLFGIPAMTRLYNWVETDLKKLLGSAFEAFWQTAFPGYFVKATNSGGLTPEERAELTKETDSFVNTLKRWIIMGGVDIVTLRADWKDPTPGLEAILKVCAISEGCPLPTFVGAEEGQLAGDQNTTSWGKSIQRRRIRHAGPKIVKPLFAAFIALAILDAPQNGFEALWLLSSTMTPVERAAYAKAMVEAIVGFVRGGGNAVLPTVSFLTKICGFEQDEAMDMLAQAEEEMAGALGEVDPATGLPIDPADAEDDPEADMEDSTTDAAS